MSELKPQKTFFVILLFSFSPQTKPDVIDFFIMPKTNERTQAFPKKVLSSLSICSVVLCARALVGLRSLTVLSACAINFPYASNTEDETRKPWSKIQSSLNCILVFSIISKHLRALPESSACCFFRLEKLEQALQLLLRCYYERPQIQFLCYTSIRKQCLTWLWRESKLRNALKCRILHLIIISTWVLGTTDRLGQLFHPHKKAGNFADGSGTASRLL